MKTRSRGVSSRQNSKISDNDQKNVPSAVAEVPQRPEGRPKTRKQQRQRRPSPSASAAASKESHQDSKLRTRRSSRQPVSENPENARPVRSVATRSARSSSSTQGLSRDSAEHKQKSSNDNSHLSKKGKSRPNDQSSIKELAGKAAPKSRQVGAEGSLKNDESAAKATNPSQENEILESDGHDSHPLDVVVVVDEGEKDKGTNISRSRGPKLHEPTLQIVKTYLEQHVLQTRQANDELDDDNMVQLILRTQKNTAASQSQQGEKTDDSTVISDDTALKEELESREFEHAVGHDIFRKIAEETSPNSQKTSILDKRTMNWIKRAAGLHRDAGYPLGLIVTEDAKHTKQKRMSTRRCTRKMVTDRRDEKKHTHKSRLHELAAAVDELEAELGPFPLRPTSLGKRRNQKKKSEQRERRRILAKEQESYSSSGEENGDEHKSVHLRKRRKKERTEEIETVKSNRSKGGKKETNDIPARKSSRINAKLQQQGKKKRKCDVRETDVITNKKPKDVVSLRNLDWLWRQQTQFYSNGMMRTRQHRTVNRQETEASFRSRNSLVLHPTLVQSGVIHRLPRIHNFQLQNNFIGDNAPERIYDPPRRRHEHDDVYATLCSRLLKSLHGPARMFATFEFFYSDLDREWYNENPFEEDALKLGIPRNARLTRKEWAAVRRRIRRKPRRFSKRFVMSQFNDRNAYRNMVRKIQNNPLLSESTDFPYNVYAPIRVGTMVTAYNKRFRIIQRGRVLTYDRHTALYLIEFENKQFGFELCPDSEVAACGGPQTLLHGASNRKDTLFAATPTPPLAAVSGTGPFPIVNKRVDDTAEAEENAVAELLHFHPFNSPNKHRENRIRNHFSLKKIKRKKETLLDKIANHEAFTSLLEVIDMARNRKHDLLACLEDTNALMVGNLPFGNSDDSSTPASYSCPLEMHVAWIRTNLEETNRILATAMKYLRTLYGEAYLPQISNKPLDGDNDENVTRDRILRSAFESKSYNDNQCANWVISLVGSTRDVGSELVQSVLPLQSEDTGSPCEKLLNRHMLAAGQLLCTASYAETLTAQAAISRFNTSQVFEAIFHENFSSALEFPVPGGPDLFYSEVLDARERARKDLEEAITLFNGELELAKLKWSVNAPVR